MTTMGDIISRTARCFTPALHVYYPITIARGSGVYVVSTAGRQYLDFSSGLAVLNIGHNHPRVVDAVTEQLHRFVHTGWVYYNEASVVAAEQLLSVTPPGLDMLFFSNSGAEAVEGALKLARYVSRRQGIISFTGGFHGRTLGATSITTSSARYRSHYHPLLPSVFQVPYPYCYRCPHYHHPEGCQLCCMEQLQQTLQRQIAADEVAAVIIEPVLGEGGYVPAPANFLLALRRLCDTHGILLIFDEVQSGMGRTGRWFAQGHSGVVPDIMTVAKGIASGFPLSAVVARRSIMEQWPEGAHGTTFGGNPISCTAACTTIQVIKDEGLLASATRLGGMALNRLHRLAADAPVIGDVRGVGFMIGVEFVTESGAANGAACQQVLSTCLDKGLILINCGTEKNVIRFAPPLVTTEQQMNEALDILEYSIRRLQ